MNEYRTLQLMSNTGVDDMQMSCNDLTRLYARKVSELSDHLSHDDLLELLTFGGLLYAKAFQGFQASLQIRNEGEVTSGVRPQKRPVSSRQSKRIFIDEDDSPSVVRVKALRLGERAKA